MDPLLKHYFDVLALKPTTDKNLISEAYERKACAILLNKPAHTTNDLRSRTLEEAFTAIETAKEALLGNSFTSRDIQVEDASVPDDGTPICIDKLRRELGALKAHVSDRDAMIANQEKKHIVDKYESQIQALQDSCARKQKRINCLTAAANQDYEIVQKKNELHEDLERRHSALEKEHCELEGEHVELCLELARWKANYRELSFVIGDLEEID